MFLQCKDAGRAVLLGRAGMELTTLTLSESVTVLQVKGQGFFDPFDPLIPSLF